MTPVTASRIAAAEDLTCTTAKGAERFAETGLLCMGIGTARWTSRVQVSFAIQRTYAHTGRAMAAINR